MCLENMFYKKEEKFIAVSHECSSPSVDLNKEIT